MIDSEEEFLLTKSGMYVGVYNRPGTVGSSVERSMVLIVPPLFEELPRTRKVMVGLARAFAGSGVTAVRFDYRGTGLSEGSFDEVTLASTSEDLDTMLDYCRQRGTSEVLLVGLRFGGYLAASLLGNSFVRRVALWEPLLDLGAYFRQMLRMEVANQLITVGEIRDTQEILLGRLKAGESIVVDGYRVNPGLVEQFESATVLSLEGFVNAGGKLELFFWEGRKAMNRATELGLSVHCVRDVRFSWQNIRFLQPRHEGLFRQTRNALLAGASAAEGSM